MIDQVPKAIEQLQLDHRNMSRLLDIVQKELDSGRNGGTPDFDLLDSVMEYTLNYPEICHHPKEDLIFRRMVRRDPSVQARVGDLIAEHPHLAELSRKLAAALHNISQDVEVPRDLLDHLVEDFVTSNRRHITEEERRFLPLAMVTLTDDDWDEIDASATARVDPLFGGRDGGGFRSLYDRIMRLNL